MGDALRTQGWRFPADPRKGPITGVIRREAGGKLSLWTTDRKKKIAALLVVSEYTTPRHTPGTEMVSYRAVIGDAEWFGRASGLLLTLRRRKKQAG